MLDTLPLFVPAMMDIGLCMKNYIIVMILRNSVRIEGIWEELREIPGPMEMYHTITIIKRSEILKVNE